MKKSRSPEEEATAVRFSHLMNVRDRIKRDATLELFAKVRTMPAVGAESLALLDRAVDALRLLPQGSVSFGRNSMLVSVHWPPAQRDGRPLRHHLLATFEAGLTWLAFGFHYLPYRDPGVDGKTFLSWYAVPADDCEMNDMYRDTMHMEGVLPYHGAVSAFDPTHPEAEVEIMLDLEWDQALEFPDPRKDLGEIPMPQTAEEALRAQVAGERGRRGMLRLPAPKRCNVCQCDLTTEMLLVDGRLDGSLEWADMCPRCAVLYGAGIGPGDGQIYERRKDGNWSCIGGLEAKKQK